VTSDSDRLEAIKARLRAFVAEREWEQFHDPKNLAMAIASEAGELLAELRWVHNSDADAFLQDETNRKRVEQEVADIAIALLLFCDRARFDAIDAIARKIELNERNYPVSQARGKPERPLA
jgi:NTP pyrophosphatase (non-canonical NTP hydrolase)